MYKSILLTLALTVSACMPDVDDAREGSDEEERDTRPTRPSARDVSSPDMYVPPTTCTDGWWCVNGGICQNGVCVILSEDQRLGIQCGSEVTLTLWGNRFPGDRLGDSFVWRANERYTATTQVTAITVEPAGTSGCECYQGSDYTGGAGALPMSGFGCANQE